VLISHVQIGACATGSVWTDNRPVDKLWLSCAWHIWQRRSRDKWVH